jgi:hypothetical protein
MSETCPSCGAAVRAEAKVCASCLHILDREAWAQHDAGQLGADARGGGRELEDPPVGPLPVTGSGLAGGTFGVANAGLRLLGARLLARVRRRSKPTSRRSRTSRHTHEEVEP